MDAVRIRHGATILGAVAALLLGCGGAPPEVVRPAAGASLSERVAGIERAIESARERLDVPGFGLAIVRDDEVLLARGFGVRDREAALPVTTHTLFPIGSITKTFTALAAAISADEGKLALDDPPRRYLPWFHLNDPEIDAQVTLRDLLSHRTGLKPVDDEYGWFERLGGGEQLVRAAMAEEFAGAFRESFHYNNAMFVAAGEAVGAAQGLPWAEVIRSRILVPLRMSATTLSYEDLARSRELAVGYGEGSPRQPLTVQGLAYLDAIPPAGAMASDIEDMTRWLRFFLGDGVLEGRRLVSERGLHELETAHVRTNSAEYGLGLSIEPWHGHRRYFHNGGVPGFGSRFEFLPDERVGFVVLTNVDDQQLPNAVREIVYAALLDG